MYLHRTYHTTSRVGPGVPAPYVPHHITCRTRCTCTVRTTPHHVSDQVHLHRTYHTTSRVGPGAPAPYVPHHITCRTRCTCTFLCVHSFCVCAPARERACVRACATWPFKMTGFGVSSRHQTRVKQNFALNYMQSRGKFLRYSWRPSSSSSSSRSVPCHSYRCREPRGSRKNPPEAGLAHPGPGAAPRSPSLQRRGGAEASYTRASWSAARSFWPSEQHCASRKASQCACVFSSPRLRSGVSSGCETREISSWTVVLSKRKREERERERGTERWWEGIDNAKMEVRLVWINLKFCGRANKLVFGGGGGGGGGVVGRCTRARACVCVCVCVCEGEGGGEEGRRKKQKWTDYTKMEFIQTSLNRYKD